MGALVPSLVADPAVGARALGGAVAAARAGRDRVGRRPGGPAPLRPRDDGLLEVAAADVSTEGLAEALAEQGVLVVRALAGPAEVAAVREAARSACRAVDGLIGAAPADDAPATVPFQQAGPLARHYQDLRHINRVCQGAMVADWPQALEPLVAVLAATALPEAIAGHLGEQPTLAVEKSVLRHVPAEVPPTPFFPTWLRGWHQDGTTWEDPSAAVNVWLAAERCGGATGLPGIELLPRSGGVALPLFSQGGPDGYEATVRRLLAAGPAVRPLLDAGDAVVFDGRLVHRTALADDCTASRASAELWFFAPSRFPGRLHPLALGPTATAELG